MYQQPEATALHPFILPGPFLQLAQANSEFQVLFQYDYGVHCCKAWRFRGLQRVSAEGNTQCRRRLYVKVTVLQVASLQASKLVRRWSTVSGSNFLTALSFICVVDVCTRGRRGLPTGAPAAGVPAPLALKQIWHCRHYVVAASTSSPRPASRHPLPTIVVLSDSSPSCPRPPCA